MVNLAITRPKIPDSLTSGSRISEDSPTPSERRIKATYGLPESSSFGERKPSNCAGLDPDGIKTSASKARRRGVGQSSTPHLASSLAQRTTSSSSDLSSDENEAMAAFEDFEVDGISPEEMKYWSKLAPEDQKLAEVQNSPIYTSKTPKGNIADTSAKNRVALYIREHDFFLQYSDGTNTHTTAARREFERNVYDFARDLGLPKKDAKQQVIRARQFCGELEYDSENSALGAEVSEDDAAESQPSKAATEQRSHSARHNSTVSDRSNHSSRVGSTHPPPNSGRSPKRKSHNEDEQDPAAGLPKKKRPRSGSEPSNVNKNEVESTRLAKTSASIGEDRANGRSQNHTSLSPQPMTEPVTGDAPKRHHSFPDGDESTVDESARAPADPSNEDVALKEERKEAKKKRRREKRHADEAARKPRKAERPKAERKHVRSVKDVAPTEPKSQSEAHENYVRSTARDPHDGGPSTKKDKTEKRKSKDEQTAVVAELRALNSEVNDRQIQDYEHGELKGASKAVKNSVEEAKIEKERIVEDEKAGKRDVEKSSEEAAKKKRRKRASEENATEQSPSKSKKSKKKHKSKGQSASPDFPSPMIR